MKDFLPKRIFARKDKRGFSVPISNWINNELAENIRDIILDKKTTELGLFDRQEIEKMVTLHNKKLVDYGPQIWSLFIMSLWVQNNNISL